LVLSDTNEVSFNAPISTLSDRTLVVEIAVRTKSVTLYSAQHNATFVIPSMFEKEKPKIEWFWIEWDANFDYIGLGNSQYFGTPINSSKYSDFFQRKLGREEHLFNYFNLAWDAVTGKCYGQIIVQLPPVNVETAKGCYENSVTSYQPAPGTIVKQPTYAWLTASPTGSPTVSPTSEPSNEPTIEPTREPTTEPSLEATQEVVDPEPTESGERGADKNRLSGGAIAGIVIAILLALAALAAVAWYMRKKKAAQNQGQLHEVVAPDAAADEPAAAEEVQMTNIVVSGAETGTAQNTGDDETGGSAENETKEEEEDAVVVDDTQTVAEVMAEDGKEEEGSFKM